VSKIANMKLDDTSLPLIPILRGVEPDEVIAIAHALLDQGYSCVEVPLNSPQAMTSLARLRNAFPEIVLGAGTVMQTSEVDALADLGVDLILAPNCNPEVIRRAVRHGMQAMPGVATPSECFMALAAGTTLLKAFPAEMLPPKVIKAWRAVLPAQVQLYAVGGIQGHMMAAYLEAGIRGFGIGSSVFAPGDSAIKVAIKAQTLKQSWDACHGYFQT
jgi:2-dehydro-3-deoxyphosphogalactonate aldolase